LVPRVIFDSGGPGAPPQAPSRAGPIERVPSLWPEQWRAGAHRPRPSCSSCCKQLPTLFFLVILRAREGLPLTRGLTPRAKPECTAARQPSWMPAHATAVLQGLAHAHTRTLHTHTNAHTCTHRRTHAHTRTQTPAVRRAHEGRGGRRQQGGRRQARGAGSQNCRVVSSLHNQSKDGV
jgi:hypothetical protein